MQIILYGGPIYTGIDDELLNQFAILIEDTKIKKIDTFENLYNIAPKANCLNVKNRTILPGLTDAHRHLISSSAERVTTELISNGMINGVLSARKTVEEGITNVRDPGCRHYGIFILRQAINEKRIQGPHLFAAGPNPTSESAPKTWRNIYVHDPWTIRQAVRQLKRDGADWVKVIVSGRSADSGWKFTQRYLSYQEMEAAADEAHAQGMKISGHIEAREGTRSALDAGFDAIEHGTGIDHDLADEIAKRGVFYVPTLSFLYYNDIESVWGSIAPETKLAIEEYRIEHARSFQYALEAGVKIAVGTDYATSLPPESNSIVSEMELLLKNGMTNAQVLKSAIVIGAEITCRGDRAGKISVGYDADIIAIEGNPLKKITALKNVDLVIKGGDIVKTIL